MVPITKATLVRIFIFALAWLNTALEKAGYPALPVVSEADVALFITFVVSVWALWKDNPLTKKARAEKKAVEASKTKSK